MDLDEKQAKEILDFLATKVGFDEIVIRMIKYPFKHYLIGCKRRDDIDIIYLLYVASGPNKPTNVLSIHSMSCKEALENLLKKSREDAKDIWCGTSERLFLSRHTSLEEILIEMDLSN